MIIAIDLETTGLDKYKDKIIEIALVKFDEKNFKIVETFSTFINPKINIPDLISNITNIFDSDVENAPMLDELKKDILDFIWDTPLLWHNTFFDRDFFIENWINISNNIILDTFFLANFLCYKESSLNLEMLCKSFEIPFSWAHRALNDVKVTIILFEKLIIKFKSLKKENKELIKFIFLLSEDKNIDFMVDYLFDSRIKDITFLDFEKIVLKKIWKQIEIKELHIDKKLKAEKIADIYTKIWSLEKRENQLNMTKIVLDAFETSKKTVIEAPTGLWKSFAYLIPSILHSVKTWEKVFISTKTKALQDQLYFKDLELLEKKIWIPFNYVKIKWRKNYISLKWFFDELILDEINYNKVNFLSKILLWLDETKYWELEELNYFWIEYSYLSFINADSSLILKDSNNYLEYEFYYKARQNLANSNIIVLNHSLLFSDLKTDNLVFWKIWNLVLDEGHNIEDSITESLKLSINEKNINDFFHFIDNILFKKNLKRITFLKLKENLLSNILLFLDFCFNYLNTKINSEDKYKILLLKRDFFENIDFSELSKKIELSFLDMIDLLSVITEHDFTKEITLLHWFLDIIKIILDKQSDKNYIKIINYNDKIWVTLEYTLLNPWEYLKSNLWDKLNSLVLTSATLKIWESFDYINKILFLEGFYFHSFESDFDYKKQATLFIPNDLWSIKNNTETIVKFLWRFYMIVAWKTLTLLTSFNIIRKIYTELNIDLKKNWITLYAQWIAWSKTKLLSFFMDNPEQSILLWTNSFWEWIDIPWENLKYLIIHKIPFWVPTDPIFQARSIFFKDPFKDYSIPKTIIKLKQWFWRLIRWKNDKWMVILLDDRIINTKWWKEFFNAFPKGINVKKWESNNLLNLLENIKNEKVK